MFNNFWSKAGLFLLLFSTTSADHESGANLTAYNGKIYFAKVTNSIASVLEVDGSTVTTIKTFDSGEYISYKYSNNTYVIGVVAGGKLYFKTNKYTSGVGSTYTLWSYDGTTFESLFSVLNAQSTGYLYPGDMFAYDGKLHFPMGSTSSGISNPGFSLYTLIGSDTTKVATISTGANIYNPQNFTILGNDLYFTQYGYTSGSSNYYLKKYDGSSITTVKSGNNYYNNLKVFDNKLYWNTSNYSNNVTTFTFYYYDPSDGSSGGGSSSEQVAVTNGYLYGGVVFSSKLVFFKRYNNSTTNGEIIAFDGTSFSTLVSSSTTGGYMDWNSIFIEYQNRLLWSASSSGQSGNYKLYAFDGSAIFEPQNTTLPPAKVATTTFSSVYGSNKVISGAAESNDIFYFSVKDNSTTSDNVEIWSYTIAAPDFIAGYPVSSNISNDNFEIKVKTDKAGTLYYVVLVNNAGTPTAAEVKAGTDASGNTDSVTVSGSSTLTAETEKSISITTGYSGAAAYDVYVVLEDNSTSPLLQSSATLIEITTSANALPIFASGSPSVSVASDGLSITLSITADVTGKAYYVLLADGATAPDNTDVKNGTGKAGGSTYASSSVTITANTAATATISSLTESTKYDAYIVVEDNASTPNIQSSATRVDINTDKTSPTITAPSATGITTTSFDFGFKINEAGTGYYVVVAKGVSLPTATQIKNGQDFSGNTDSVSVSGSVVLRTDVENTVSITGLSSETSYTVYYAAEDGNSNLVRGSAGFDVTTVAQPKKYTISGSGTTLSGTSSDYTTIQQGISVAKTSTDTLVVSAGTYTENIDFGGKDIYIKSESGASSTILKPANTGIPIVSFIGNETSSAKLIGFTLTNGGNLRGSAIQFNNSSPIIENCIITASGGEGAVSFYYSSATLKNCVIYGNTSTNPLYFDASNTSPLINNCTIASNAGYGGGYISPSLTIAPTFQNSILWNNTSGGVSGRYTISNSIVQGGFPTGTSILSSDPVFVDLVNSDFKLSDYSPAIGTASSETATTEDIVSTVRGSPPDMGAYEHSSTAPLSDTGAPTVSHVREGTTGDLSYIGTATQISAHWNGSDAASGIKKYEYAVDTTTTTITGQSIKDWTSAGTDTSVTIDSLSLVEGKTYYVYVKATDKLDNVSDVVTSNGVKIDITAPTVGSVVHGTDNHLQWLSDTSGAKATWSGFSDGMSGIKEYEVHLRDTLNKKSIVDWTNVGLELTYSFTALALVNNGQYYLKVRASDKVGNLSHVAESSVFQVDNEKPVVTTLFETMEGKTDDVDWFAPDDKIVHRFVGTDNGAILQYEFAIGTTESTDDIIAWAVTVNDSSDTTVTDTLEEGKLYYTNLKLKDKAGNLGDIFSSDGFRIDGSPPKSGQVSDGASEDIDFSESSTSTIVNWSGFTDNGSGISHYLVSLGTTSGGEEVHQSVDVGNVSNYLFTGLYLEHGVTYYSSVVAVDSVGIESINVSSDGFTMDVYPGPPQVASRKPDETTLLSLISGGHLVFKFSEPVESVDLSIYSKLGDEVQFERIDYSDSIAIALSGPLTSLDTIQVELGQLTDESGRVGNDTLFSFYNEMIADYNHDAVIDASDLSLLVTGWMNEDYFYELGPVEGEAPYFVPIVDMEYDLRDLMIFTRMWHWYHDVPQLLNLARVNFGEEILTELNENFISITVPDGIIAGQLAFQMSDNELSITLPDERTGDVILLSNIEAGNQQSVMDFAYFKGNGERNFVLPLEYGRHSSTITLSYALYGKDGVLIGQGVKTMEVAPVPAEFVLDQNYPNPFNPTTKIVYGLPVDGQVKLTVYDLLGQEVRSLISGLDQSAGYHNILWDARDNRGLTVSAGVYIYRLASRGKDGQKFSRTKKMVLLK